MNKTLLVLTAVTMLAATAFFVLKQDTTVTLAADVPTPVYDMFVHWKRQYKRSYGSSLEEKSRLATFHGNFKRIQAHNQLGKSYTMAPNQFMDLTTEEFKAMYLSTQVPKRGQNVKYNDVSVPASVDWTGKITPVKDQGQCGSCWAFSTTGALEALSAIKGSGLQSFSEQQLVDCSGSYGNEGCGGGLMDQGFQYVIDNGITTESAYPYRAVDQSCKKNGGSFKISKFTDVPANDVDQLAAAVVGQPVSVAVDAENWQFYSGGVFSDCDTNLDHGVLLVGYTADHWLVKNSWNTSWGEQGFIRLARGNTCGIAAAASYPSL